MVEQIIPRSAMDILIEQVIAEAAAHLPHIMMLLQLLLGAVLVAMVATSHSCGALLHGEKCLL